MTRPYACRFRCHSQSLKTQTRFPKWGRKNLRSHFDRQSIARAQAYYNLIKQVKNGEKSLSISENVKKVLPDFPKVAITYSVTENEADSYVNQAYMEESLEDYNAMFGTHFSLATIASYNSDPKRPSGP